MRKLFVALGLMFVMTGCATTCPAPTVEYRVVTPAEPPVIERPQLDSVNISSSMDAGSIIQAFRTDIKKLQSTIAEHEKALDAYRTKK